MKNNQEAWGRHAARPEDGFAECDQCSERYWGAAAATYLRENDSGCVLCLGCLTPMPIAKLEAGICDAQREIARIHGAEWSPQVGILVARLKLLQARSRELRAASDHRAAVKGYPKGERP